MKNRDRKDICMKPWISAIASYNGATCCCQMGRCGALYEDWKGPYVGDFEWWNGDFFKEMRGDMLKDGMYKCCKGTSCPELLKSETPEERLGPMKKCIPDEQLEYFLNLVDNNEVVVECTPLNAQVIITLVCDAKCTFCIQFSTKDRIMHPPNSSEAYSHIGKWAKDASAFRIVGGECLVLTDEELSKLLLPLKNSESSKPFCLTTNGQRLTLERYNKWVHEGPISMVDISIDSVDPESYLFNRGVKVDNVVENIRQIANAHPHHKIRTLICVVTKKTLPHLEKVLHFAKEVNISSVHFSPVFGSNMEINGVGEYNIFGEGYTEEFAKHTIQRMKDVEKVAETFDISLAEHTKIEQKLNTIAESKRS